MAGIDRATLRKVERRILCGLVKFYYEDGYKITAYKDPDTGGVYEHKLANRLGFELMHGRSPPDFVEACRALEAQGYVRRMRRDAEFPEMGIWPTDLGLERAEYLGTSLLGKALIELLRRWPDVLVAAVTTIITLLIGWLLGLFGLRS